MNRREFMHVAAMATPAMGVASHPSIARRFDVSGGRIGNSGWRTYEVSTSVKVLRSVGETRVWLPRPLAQDTKFQKALSNSVQCVGGRTYSFEERRTGLKMLGVTFPADSEAAITMTERVATRDWSVDLRDPKGPFTDHKRPLPADTASFLRPTQYVPTDGIVKATANEITSGARTDVEKTHAIYDWIVRNTYRDPKVRGCGVGDIKPMLETGDLRGKCADLNGLFVGLVKASGVPARDVYGIRVGPSALDDSSLGTSSRVVSKAQHCRAEVYLIDFGWVPMDPADVRKVILEEPPGNLSLADSRVESVQHRLFGSWEMNWIAYNYAQDVVLPRSSGPKLHFFMYPQAETEEGRLDCLDPESFRYEINSRELISDSN